MKRIGNLFEKVVNLNNLHLAELAVRKGKSKKKYVIEFNKNRTENIWKLYLELINNSYKVSKYQSLTIYEPKKRILSKPNYRDRIIHHAVIQILEPILTKCFISQTYSCIKNRGLHKGLKVLNSYLKDKENTKYTLKLDIKKFYQSVGNKILINLLKTKFKDKKLLNLLEIIINSHKALPLGSYTSQWFGNFYTNKFNHWLKEKKKVKYLVIYCDDYVILHHSKKYLHNLRKEIQEYLKENLNLELSNYQVFPTNKGIDFLGYVSYPTHIKIRKSIKQRWIKMLKTNQNSKSIASYTGWLKYCNSINLKNKYLK